METNNNPHVIREIGFSNLDNSLYATIMYVSGIPEFDAILGGSLFSETDAIMSIISTANSIYFVLLTNDLENVLARIEVKRETIINYTKNVEKEIKIQNFNRFKAILPGAFGIRGVQIESIIKGIKKKSLFKVIGSKEVKGNEFELKYSNNQKEQIIKLCSYDIHAMTLVQFLKAYWNTEEIVSRGNSSSGGCYIATACYQYPNCKELKILYNFRNKILFNYLVGRFIVEIYYAISPSIAKYLSGANFVNTMVKLILLKPIIVLIKISFRKYL